MNKKQEELFKKIMHVNPDEQRDIENVILFDLEMLTDDKGENWEYHFKLLRSYLDTYFMKYGSRRHE